MAYVTEAEVRLKSGAPTSLIDSSDVNSIITLVTENALSYFDISDVPVDTIDFIRCYDLNKIMVRKQKIMTVKEISLNSSTSTITSFGFNSDLGKLFLKNKAGSIFDTYLPRFEPYKVKVRYSHAFLTPNGTVTESTAAASIGTSINIAVDDETNFTVNSYVKISGFDGNSEVAKITATTTNQITVDRLYYSHESGSVLEELSIPNALRQFILYESAVAIAIKAIGGTYELATSYSSPKYTITKGVPYPHWEKSFSANQEERKRFEEIIWAMLSTTI